MNNSIFKISAKLGALFFPFFICVGLVFCFPMKFFDRDYAAHIQNKNYSEKHDDYCRVLIIGDSTAKVSWLPELLSSDCYNFALGGGDAHRRVL